MSLTQYNDLTVTRERWRQLEELYHAALNLPTEERKALLKRADPELRASVASLLAQDSAAPDGGFSLDRPAWEGRESLLETASIFATGTRLGPYHIEQRIGRGGMGEVFRAMDTRLNRIVAIKTSMVQFTERFERNSSPRDRSRQKTFGALLSKRLKQSKQLTKKELFTET
jgi:hypothetical protein